jgi:hypothetical protein
MKKVLLMLSKNKSGEERGFFRSTIQVVCIKIVRKLEVSERRTRLWNALMRGTEFARELALPPQDHSPLPLFTSSLAIR